MEEQLTEKFFQIKRNVKEGLYPNPTLAVTYCEAILSLRLEDMPRP